MSNSYIGSDLDDIGFDEGPNVDNESDQDEDPSRTFKVRIILASNRPPPETFADLIHYHNALNNWMREAEGLFNFDKNNPVKLDTCEWMHEGKEAPLPTDEELKDAHAVIVAGSMDASDESEEWNEQLRTYIESNALRLQSHYKPVADHYSRDLQRVPEIAVLRNWLWSPNHSPSCTWRHCQSRKEEEVSRKLGFWSSRGHARTRVQSSLSCISGERCFQSSVPKL